MNNTMRKYFLNVSWLSGHLSAEIFISTCEWWWWWWWFGRGGGSQEAALVINYLYQGLWLADLNADVISQSMNRRGVALDFHHFRLGSGPRCFARADVAEAGCFFSTTEECILEVGHPGITCEQPISCARYAWLHSSECGALVGG